MTRTLARFVSSCLAMLAALALGIEPALAQGVLRDTETEILLHDLAAPLVAVSGLDPHNVDVVLYGDPSINAFVAGGQVIYINAGLIDAAGSAEEVQGVIAHELGHITGGHVINDGGSRAATGISILSLILGGLAAAAGAGDAAIGVLMAGQQAALGKYLAFSRAQEATADAAGATFLSKAGISGRGSLNFFKRLQNMEMRYGFKRTADSEFYSSHPMTSDRIQTLQDTYSHDPAWLTSANADQETRFQRIKAKLMGYSAEPARTLQVYPETDQGVPARYARAYAFHKEAFMDKALAECDALLAGSPEDPYFLELKGQILLESGRAQDALAPLRRASEITQFAPLIATLFGHALIATEDPAHLPEAERVLKAALSRDRDNPFGWYELSVIYGQRGDMARARLAAAEQQVLQLNFPAALQSAQAAEAALPKDSPDWLRAQDIAMQSRAMIEQTKKRR